MASRKIKDLAVKVGSYTDRNSGQDKSKFENVGALMQSDDGSMFVMLKRTFNPAGVPGQDGRESLLISAFDPRPPQGQQSQGGYDGGQRSGGASSGGQGYGGGGSSAPSGGGGRSDFEDDVPF